MRLQSLFLALALTHAGTAMAFGNSQDTASGWVTPSYPAGRPAASFSSTANAGTGTPSGAVVDGIKTQTPNEYDPLIDLVADYLRGDTTSKPVISSEPTEQVQGTSGITGECNSARPAENITQYQMSNVCDYGDQTTLGAQGC